MSQRLRAEQEHDFAPDDLFNQRIGQTRDQQNSEWLPSPKQRLTLAIASLFTLILLSVATLGFATNGGHTLTWPGLALGAILIGMFCVAIAIINVVFNLRR
jgi:hypothetical protein